MATPRPGLLLDRDGIVNRERGTYTYRPEDFELQQGLYDLLAWAEESGRPVAIITNQGGIAKGLYTLQDVHALHAQLGARLQERGLALPQLFCCPHHHTVSNCLCRKPKSLLFERAVAKLNLKPSLSYMLGDSARDLEPARALGMRTIGVHPEKSLPADLQFATLKQAADYLKALP